MIAVLFEGKQRDTAIAAWIAVCWGAQALGPLVGGVIVEGLQWRWIFWSTCPLASSHCSSPGGRPRDPGGGRRAPHRRTRGDHPGRWHLPAVLGARAVRHPAHLCLHRHDCRLAPALRGLRLIERRAKSPIIVLSIFRKRRFDGAVLANLIANFVFGGVIFFMSLYLQVVEGFDPLRAGLLLLPATIPILLINPLGTWLGRRVGPAWPTAVGMACLAVAAFLLLDLSGDYSQLIVPFVLIGIGIGLQITPCAATAVEDPAVLARESSRVSSRHRP